MANQPFEYGVFKRYKATHEFHVGAMECNLYNGEIIETDGSTLKRGGQQFSVPSIVAAIKVGWLVPEGEEGTPYRPKPAGVEIHQADPKGQTRGPAKKMMLVEDEQRSVGTLDQVRAKSGAKAPPTHVAGNSGEEYRAGVGAHVTEGFNSELITETAAGQEGRVISKFKTSAKGAPVDLSKGEDRQIRSKIAAQTGLDIERATATGDVQEARSGDELDELLPNAASSGRPAGGTAGEGGKETADERAVRLAVAAQKAAEARAARMGAAKAAEAAVRAADGEATVSGSGEMVVPKATTSSPQMSVPKATFSPGMTPIGGAEDGEIVGSVSGGRRAAPVEEIVFEDPEGEEIVFEDPEGEGEPDLLPSEKALLAAKIEGIQALLPGFTWDVEAHWATRVKTALEQYAGNMPYMNAILAIETETVKKHIMKRLYG